LIWHIGAGEHTIDNIAIGNIGGYSINGFDRTFYFEGGADYLTWEITWS